jgi:hypothetical protein
MITADTAKLQADLGKLNAKLNERFQLLGGRKPVIVKRQAGLLARELMDVSPPKNRKKTADSITNKVMGKFHTMGEDRSGHVWSQVSQVKAGNGDVRWYAFGKHAIYGIAKEADMTEASVDSLYQLYYGRTLAKSGRFMAGNRGSQAVYIWQKITTRAATVRALAKQIVSHIGRLKAGWIVGWKAAGAPGRVVPQWIAKHTKPRGYFVDGLASPSQPSFTIANTAKGVSSQAVNDIARAAVRSRIGKLQKDIEFAITNPKEWSEREAKTEAATGGE